jgi:hypothetical protein
MHTNNILVPDKFGFRRGISSEDVAFTLTDKVLKYINKKFMLQEFYYQKPLTV